eukprot:TRINITY_DN6052_c0_g1_i4.p1 TRINITY_DN6052_c0_g1~~TRINITY_DN6052_c0_g1_i4.p1  ORF type:complete len:166 (-),score=25.66 TRINITY_DN6052_c0_g1_i4:183-680(-)
MDPKTFIGPLARPQQAQLLAKQVTDAVSKGADLLCGGSTIKIKSLDGVFFQPTVLLHCNGSMQVMHEESFGPIVGIQVVESDDEAVELMNEGVYGLTSGVFSTSREKAESIMKRLDTGTVYWNACDRVNVTLPWTGRRKSGVGVTCSIEGIKTFVVPKAWHMKRG